MPHEPIKTNDPDLFKEIGMSNVQEALKAAIAALEDCHEEHGVWYRTAIDQCKSALSEIEKCEPGFIVKIWHDENGNYCRNQEFLNIPESDGVYKYYTSPQPREWVGLTCEQKVNLREENDWYNFPNDLIEATEAKLKQLNTKG